MRRFMLLAVIVAATLGVSALSVSAQDEAPASSNVSPLIFTQQDARNDFWLLHDGPALRKEVSISDTYQITFRQIGFQAAECDDSFNLSSPLQLKDVTTGKVYATFGIDYHVWYPQGEDYGSTSNPRWLSNVCSGVFQLYQIS